MVNLKRIKELREERGLSIAKISKELGYKTQQGYFYIEKGKTKLKVDHLLKLARILNVKINDLLEEDRND